MLRRTPPTAYASCCPRHSGLGALARWLGQGSLLATVALGATTAHAHMGSTKAVRATVTADGATLDVDVQTVDAALALGLGPSASIDAFTTHAALVQGWLGNGLGVHGQSGPCTSAAVTPPQAVQRDGTDNVRVTLQYTCPQPMGTLTLSDQTVFDDDPDHEVFVAVVGTTGEQVHVLRAAQRSVTLNRPAAATATARAFVIEGGRHLLSGYDHMLFLLSLIVAAGLRARQDGLRTALRGVAWVVTAFTLGHSLSLVAATLGWVSLPSRWVEAAIAASIVAVAGMNVLRPRAAAARPWLAGAFGLVHGFGFSSVLAEVGVPASQRLLALASFNVGIELAQLACVAAVLIPLSAAARSAHYRLVVMQGGSLAIAAVGCVWLVQRVAG